MNLKNLKKCPYCKRVFVPDSARQKFCNPICRINYYNLKEAVYETGKEGKNN